MTLRETCIQITLASATYSKYHIRASCDRYLIRLKYVAKLLAWETITAPSSGRLKWSSKVTWQQFVIDEGSPYTWLHLMTGRRVLISMDSHILRRHILSSRTITSTLSNLMGCSWSPTTVRGDFCFRWSFILVSRVRAVSPTYCAGHSRHCLY